MPPRWLLAFACLLQLAVNCKSNDTNITSSEGAADVFSGLTIFYYDIKPIISTKEDEVNGGEHNSSVDGALSEYMTVGEAVCYPFYWSFPLARYMRIAKSRAEFSEKFFSNKTASEIAGMPLDESRIVWFPVMIDNLNLILKRKRKNLMAVKLTDSEELAVIVKRSHIEISNKVFIGLSKCQEIIAFSVVFALTVSAFLWLCEFRSNNDIQEVFLQGYGNCVWCSFVSMTTVGYGDISPTSLVGRLVMTVWVILGLVVAGIFTANVTNTLDEEMNIRGQKIAVLSHTVAEMVAQKNFEADVILEDSYDAVIEAVRKGRAYAAIMNSDVAATRQKDIRDDSYSVPLRINQRIKASQPIYMMFPSSSPGPSFISCFADHMPGIDMRLKLRKQFCRVDILYKASIRELVYTTLVQVLLSILLFLICACGIYECYLRGRANGRKKDVYLADEQETIEHIVKEECSKLKEMLRFQNTGSKLGESVFYINRHSVGWKVKN